MHCPLCKSDLRGDPIPAQYFVHKDDCKYTEGKFDKNERCFCLPYGNKAPEDRFYGRQILVEISGVYDGGLFYCCPDCGDYFHRWPEGHSLHEVAEREMEKLREQDLKYHE